MESLYEWLLGVSNVLATRFGTRWTTAWAQAGFVNHSTRIPTKTEEQLGLALSLVKFFTANPTFEVPSMKLTAAEGTTLRNAALTGQQAVTTATVALNTIGEAWTKAYDVLVAAMRQHADQEALPSVHVNFLPESELPAFDGEWLARCDVQFNWRNDAGWADFDQFLGAFSSRKRKNLVVLRNS